VRLSPNLEGVSGSETLRIAALAARDYFFDTPLKRAYFGNFTNLIPMDRSGSLKRSLRAALTALSRGYHLLIFPEGTRTRDGAMGPFYPTAGYLALHGRVDVLPVWLGGTHEALPPGAGLPRPRLRAREILSSAYKPWKAPIRVASSGSRARHWFGAARPDRNRRRPRRA